MKLVCTFSEGSTFFLNSVSAASQAALKAKIASLSSSQSSSSTELEELKRRVNDTEREKRDLIGVISRLKQESSQREGNHHPIVWSHILFTVLKAKYKH